METTYSATEITSVMQECECGEDEAMDLIDEQREAEMEEDARIENLVSEYVAECERHAAEAWDRYEEAVERSYMTPAEQYAADWAPYKP